MKQVVMACDICNKPIDNHDPYVQASEQAPIHPLITSHYHNIGGSMDAHFHKECLLRAIDRAREETNETI